MEAFERVAARFREGNDAMKNLAAFAGTLAFAIVSTHAVAAVVAPKLNVPTPQVKLPVPKVNVPNPQVKLAVPKVNNSNDKKEMDIESFQWGESNTAIGGTGGGNGGAAGKIKFNDISITRPTTCRHCPNLVGPNRPPTK
jgi:hypothetical protein